MCGFLNHADEPTSGLDTFTAYSVIKTLRHLSKTGRTIISTIHQPSSDVFHMFDDLLLLADGKVIYQGDAAEAIPYFTKHGFECTMCTKSRPNVHKSSGFLIHGNLEQ